jgi:hypothetical protein
MRAPQRTSGAMPRRAAASKTLRAARASIVGERSIQPRLRPAPTAPLARCVTCSVNPLAAIVNRSSFTALGRGHHTVGHPKSAALKRSDGSEPTLE